MKIWRSKSNIVFLCDDVFFVQSCHVMVMGYQTALGYSKNRYCSVNSDEC